VADCRNVALGQRRPRYPRSRPYVADGARRPLANALPARARELQADQGGRVIHVGRRVELRPDVGLGPCDARQGWSPQGHLPDKGRRLEFVYRRARGGTGQTNPGSPELSGQVATTLVTNSATLLQRLSAEPVWGMVRAS
jgi:hypothetical protein